MERRISILLCRLPRSYNCVVRLYIYTTWMQYFYLISYLFISLTTTTLDVTVDLHSRALVPPSYTGRSAATNTPKILMAACVVGGRWRCNPYPAHHPLRSMSETRFPSSIDLIMHLNRYRNRLENVHGSNGSVHERATQL
jgi:hypothetical protein